MGTSLSGLTPATTFDALIKVGDNSALSASLKTISDGEGNDSPLKLSTSAVGIGSITNVETEINGKQATLVSGTNIKTINSTSLLGSGDVAVQETLVSGTNIKTINSTSLLGSGDISISASPAGSNTQIQFNDSGAFGADSLFNWDNTNKRLGVGETTPTARVHIKGEGATSATTSLLVQNSAGTNLFDITDNGEVEVTLGDFRIPSNKAIYGGGGSTYAIFPQASTAMIFKSWAKDFDFLTQNGYVAAIKNDGSIIAGGRTPDDSAVLQADSTTKGFLPPRMTTTERNAIEAAAGLVIYDTSTNKLQCYDGSSWNNLF